MERQGCQKPIILGPEIFFCVSFNSEQHRYSIYLKGVLKLYTFTGGIGTRFASQTENEGNDKFDYRNDTYNRFLNFF